MKRQTAILIAIASLTLSCGKSDSDSESNTAVTPIETQEKTEKSNLEEDMESFKKIAAERIAANEKSIAEFKARIAVRKSDARAEYEQKIAALNEQNTDMKKRISDFNTSNQSSWESFKTEFSHDMDELGKAFNSFTTDSEK